MLSDIKVHCTPNRYMMTERNGDKGKRVPCWGRRDASWYSSLKPHFDLQENQKVTYHRCVSHVTLKQSWFYIIIMFIDQNHLAPFHAGITQFTSHHSGHLSSSFSLVSVAVLIPKSRWIKEKMKKWLLGIVSTNYSYIDTFSIDHMAISFLQDGLFRPRSKSQVEIRLWMTPIE